MAFLWACGLCLAYKDVSKLDLGNFEFFDILLFKQLAYNTYQFNIWESSKDQAFFKSKSYLVMGYLPATVQSVQHPIDTD